MDKSNVLKTLKHMGAEDLKRMQAFSLDQKIELAKANIREWYEKWNGNVYVSFSGGKDSTVLLHLVRSVFPDVPAVYSNAGLEYPDIRKHVKQFENVEIVVPKRNFMQVLTEEGYPIISKDVSKKIKYVYRARQKGKRSAAEDAFLGVGTYENSMYACIKYKPLLDADFRISDECCMAMKEKPLIEWQKKTQRKPFIGIMASESIRRKNAWIRNGCNVYDSKYPCSKPLSVWTEQNIYEYIKRYDLPLAKPYGEIVHDGCKYCTTGCDRTGCIFCGYGAHLDKGRRFKELAKLEPRLYEFCLNGGERDDNGMWIPTKKGLGFRYVYDTLNSIYGNRFVEYDVSKTLF